MPSDIAQLVTAASAAPLGYLTFLAARKSSRDTARMQVGANKLTEAQQILDAQKSLCAQYKEQADYEHRLRLTQQEEHDLERRRWAKEREFLAKTIRDEAIRAAGLNDGDLDDLIREDEADEA